MDRQEQQIIGKTQKINKKIFQNTILSKSHNLKFLIYKVICTF